MNFLTKNNKLKSVSKSLVLIALFIGSPFISQAQTETKAHTLTVKVENIKNTNGKVILSLHNSESFMKAKGLKSTTTKIEGDTITLTFDNLTPGEYAIMAVHDENDNNQMDFELNGMPKESYGMSNNPVLYGPPTFDAAKFEVKEESLDITIRL